MDATAARAITQKKGLYSKDGLSAHFEELEYLTVEGCQFIDLTDEVVAVAERSGVQFGLVAVYSTHTTAAIKINENEPLLLGDMQRLLQSFAPADGQYDHDDFSRRTVNLEDEECANGHAHCQHLLLSTSETIPIMEGRLALGRYQRVFLVELDRGRQRRVIVSVVGI